MGSLVLIGVYNSFVVNILCRLLADSIEAVQYLERHNDAMRWAKANRALIAHKFMECITTEPISRKNCTVRM